MNIFLVKQEKVRRKEGKKERGREGRKKERKDTEKHVKDYDSD